MVANQVFKLSAVEDHVRLDCLDPPAQLVHDPLGRYVAQITQADVGPRLGANAQPLDDQRWMPDPKSQESNVVPDGFGKAEVGAAGGHLHGRLLDVPAGPAPALYR